MSDSAIPAYVALTQSLRRLDASLRALEPAARQVGTESPGRTDWCELLRQKLLPQADLPPLLIAAVVGGTNTGKSVLFNHLAGETASAASPLAARTCQPVLLVPNSGVAPDLLERLFPNFALRAWQAATDPWTQDDAPLLFWRAGQQVPERLLLLDTPDIDSTAEANWARAETIRQTSDVLLAILTSQKYNDAAVKRFFREAAAAGKQVYVVFNQVDLREDRPYWPQWLATFVQETGVAPLAAFVVPRDRAAAEQLRLQICSIGPDGQGEPQPVSLRETLSTLQFSQIKIRTLAGALQRVLDEHAGAAGYLAAIERACGEFRAAAELLSAGQLAQVRWPDLPPALLIDELRAWWDARRNAWSRKIHGFYRKLGQGLLKPVRAAWGAKEPPPVAAAQRLLHEERLAILDAVGGLIDELSRLAALGNPTLQPRLQKLLGGRSRGALLERVAEAHAQLPAIDDEYRAFLRGELDRWAEESPRAAAVLRGFDQAAAIVRPAMTISLFVGGWMLVGNVASHAAGSAVVHAATEIGTDAVVATTVTGGGEAVVTIAGESVSQAAARLMRRLQARFAQSRAAWLAQWLQREFLGELLGDLHSGADLPQSPMFLAVRAALDELRAIHAAHR